MILSDSVILKEIEQGNIIIDPFDRSLLNPGSVDIRLGDRFKVYTREYLNYKNIEDIPSIYETCDIRRDISGEFHIEKPLNPKENNNNIEIIIPDKGFVLQPGEIYLYSAHEKIGVKGNICARCMGKSSLGRLGLDIVIGPAGFIDCGFEGSLVLELRATRPIIVYNQMKIAQIIFERMEGKVLESYDKKEGSKYMNQEGVQASLYHKNFNNE